MISKTETKVYVCRHCGSERLRRNGKSRRGAQRSQCMECGKTLVLEPLPPAYSQAERERILHAATTERVSLRGVGRVFGPCYRTLRRWVGKKGGRSAAPARNIAARQERRRAGVR
jgi:transposase-like protein